jgi:hypothetical protein
VATEAKHSRQRNHGPCGPPKVIEKRLLSSHRSPWKHRPPLCHPERTRISCHAALDRTTNAPFSKERRMKFAKATKFNRKSGEAEGSAVPRTIPGNVFFDRAQRKGSCSSLTRGPSNEDMATGTI